jgi:peptidoglycan hydrolase-like protein with peptidoglycan-binding domain
MATVYVGSARIDERGQARGGVAGDQKGNEVAEQIYYTHSLGWVGIEAKDPAVLAKIAQQMEAACLNNKIGYDQNQRDSLYSAAQVVGFDLAKVNVPTETDCSALMRPILAYAGIMIPASPRFSTASMLSILKATGKFNIITNVQKANLKAGTILVTQSTSHTVAVLTNGDKVVTPILVPAPGNFVSAKKGSKGARVVHIQHYLNIHGATPRLDEDGDFGKLTEAAVNAFKKANGLPANGVVDKATMAKLEGVPEAIEEPGIPKAPFSFTNVPTLKFGSKGDAVAFLQFLLVQHGHKLPNSVKASGMYGFDGIWGDETQREFNAFQKTHKDLYGKPLEVDNICGPLSWGALIGKPCK